MDWPDDTLELMERYIGPRPPVKGFLDVGIKYPVTVPVLTDEVELCCSSCGRWHDVDDWENRDGCPRCGADWPAGHEHGEFERRAVGLFTVVLPVPEHHYGTAFDPERQAVNAIIGCRLARRHARQAGLEPA